MKHFPRLVAMCSALLLPAAALANSDFPLDAGPLTLDVHISKTANLFHAVDQIAQWSEFCHKQYVPYFQGLAGGMSKLDQDLLAQHCAVRKARGWGGGLEQTFYTPADLDSALALGVKEGRLSDEEAQTERRILTHFKDRVERLMTEESSTLHRFVQELLAKQSDLAAFAKDASSFVGGARLTVPVYLMANPHERNCGGGFNGGRLTLEIAKNYDMYPTFLHELFHAFLRTKEGAIESAARSAPGLDLETLSEGLAYAYSPGLIQAGDSGQTDQLLSTVGRFMAEGSSLKDSYPRFNAYGLALRPLLKDALSGKRRKLDEFLPRATDAWLVLTELEKARSARSDSHAHDYRKDSRQSIFIFGPYNQADCELLKKAAGRHVFGRRHAADQYKEMLANNAKPGDTIILLLSLDDPSRIPEEYSDLAASPWPPIEGFLKQGRTVVKQRKARDMNIFLIAAPTVDSLHSEFRRLAGEGKFVLDAGARTK